MELSEQQASLHLYNGHKMKNMRRLYIDGTDCPICLRQFHRRDTLLQLYKIDKRNKNTSSKCRDSLRSLGPSLTIEASDFLDSCEKAGNRALRAGALCRYHAIGPCIQMSGPKLSQDRILNGIYKRNMQDEPFFKDYPPCNSHQVSCIDREHNNCYNVFE